MTVDPGRLSVQHRRNDLAVPLCLIRINGQRPGLDRKIVASFVDAMGGTVEPKFGWTDVARFSELGTPAVNFGPGDPTIAHSVDEHVDVSEIHQVYAKVSAWLDTAENF